MRARAIEPEHITRINNLVLARLLKQSPAAAAAVLLPHHTEYFHTDLRRNADNVQWRAPCKDQWSNYPVVEVHVHVEVYFPRRAV